jgi:hypothetical protein
MAVSGLPAADLALQGAKQVLEDHERMVLRRADRELFVAAVRNPPKPAPRLTEAFRLHTDNFSLKTAWRFTSTRCRSGTNAMPSAAANPLSTIMRSIGE